MLQRRHCQQAASNAARVAQRCAWTKGASARVHRGVHVASHAQVRGVIVLRDVAQALKIIAPGVKPPGDEAKGACAPRTWRTATRALQGARSPIGRTNSRRVSTATPVRSPMEQGKEPSQRRFELTAHEAVRQEDKTHQRPSAGDCVWRLLHPYPPTRSGTESPLKPKSSWVFNGNSDKLCPCGLALTK